MFNAFKNKKTALLLLSLSSITIIASTSVISCNAQTQSRESSPSMDDNSKGSEDTTKPPTTEETKPDGSSKEPIQPPTKPDGEGKDPIQPPTPKPDPDGGKEPEKPPVEKPDPDKGKDPVQPPQPPTKPDGEGKEPEKPPVEKPDENSKENQELIKELEAEIQRLNGINKNNSILKVHVSSSMALALKIAIQNSNENKPALLKTILKALNESNETLELDTNSDKFDYEMVECSGDSYFNFKIKVTSKNKTSISRTSENLTFNLVPLAAEFNKSMKLDEITNLNENKIPKDIEGKDDIDKILSHITKKYREDFGDNVQAITRSENNELTLTLKRDDPNFENSFKAYYGKTFEELIGEAKVNDDSNIRNYVSFLEEMESIQITFEHKKNSDNKHEISAKRIAFTIKGDATWGSTETVNSPLGTFTFEN